MDRIEIRYRKKTLGVLVLAAVVIFLITMLGVFSSENLEQNAPTKISFFIGVAVCTYFMYPVTRRLLSTTPILIFDTDKVVLKEGNTKIISRQEIENMEVEYVDEKGYFLKIRTREKVYKTDISWLEMTPDEIKELIKVYMQ